MMERRSINIPKKRKKGFFHVEIDVPEEEIDELLSNEMVDIVGAQM
jgi:hypothetical protein